MTVQTESDNLGVSTRKVSTAFIDRMLAEYELADKIVLPSEYSYSSFIKSGFPPEKLTKIPLMQIFS